MAIWLSASCVGRWRRAESGGGWTEARLNNNSLPTSTHNGAGRRAASPSSTSPPRVTPPSVVVSDAADPDQHDADRQDGRRYWTTRQAGSWLLSPVYEQPTTTTTSAGGVLGGFLTLLGAGAGRRRPLRSTSFSNVASCTAAGSAATSVTAQAAAVTAWAATDEPRATLSTARPLRVYTRSSTDTELYRRRPVSARPPPAGHVVVRQRYSEQHARPSSD